jgi:thiamine-monophosphate kinase
MTKPQAEFQLINWIQGQKPDRGDHVITGIGDDMAVLQLGNETLLITTDTLLDGVHFKTETASLEEIGAKAFGCSLSDCAAMASNPCAAVVAVSLAKTMSIDQAKQLQKGFQQAGEAFNCPIVGGDTTSWDQPLAITVTMLSQPLGKEPVRRGDAQVGDAILVTGELGGSLESGKHLHFTPRLAEVSLIQQKIDLHAMIDISDGLSSDLAHICQQSNLSAILDAMAIPLSNAARTKNDPLKAALHDGEDFELLFCVSPADADTLLSSWREISSIRLSNIGQIIDPQMDIVDGSSQMYLRQINGQIHPLQAEGWEHFK